MQKFDILCPGVWFGPKSDEAAPIVDSSAGEAHILQTICAHMKLGDFSVRPQLEELIRSSRHTQVKTQAIRLYCYTCRHADVAFIGGMLENLSHDDILTVVVMSPVTLSPEIIPYLFALLHTYAETTIVPDILSAIDRLFPWGYLGEEADVDLEALADRFSGFAKSLVPGAYYYDGVPSHPGRLCKTLIEATAKYRHGQIKFALSTTPSMLSIWSGEKCPVFYGQFVDDARMQEVFDYVKRLAQMQWMDGYKYFYGHKVE